MFISTYIRYILSSMLPLGEYFFYFHCEGNMRRGNGGAMLHTLYKLGMIYVAAVAAGADYSSLQSVSPPG